MARQVTSLVMLFTPVIVLNALRFIVDPLGDMMAVSTNLDIGLHMGAFGVGYLLYRKTRVVRDHEWQRSRAVKSVGGHFRAEESGVWEKDVVMDTNLSMEAEANLKGKVGSAVGSYSTNTETEINTEVQVEMLVDAEHVRRAQARVSGDEQFGESGVDSTVGLGEKTFAHGFIFGLDCLSKRERSKSRKGCNKAGQVTGKE